MMRKIICLFLCLVLLSSLFVIPSFAENTIAPVTLADAIPVEGEAQTYDVAFFIDLVDARGVDLNIRLNPNLVETAEMIDPAESIRNAMMVPNQNGDKFKVSIASPEPINHEGRLFTLRLTLKAEASPTDELCKLLQIKVNEKITWQANDRILLTGVQDGATYKGNVTITFNEGTAKLNGEPFASGDTVAPNGEYTLIITDTGGKTRTVQFTIDRTVISVNMEWTDMSFTFDEGDWNDATHDFDNRGWFTSPNGGQLTIHNSSNVDVLASYSYTASEGFEGIGAQFLMEEESITAQNIKINESKTVLVALTGEPTEQFETTEIGTIMVTITKNGEVIDND